MAAACISYFQPFQFSGSGFSGAEALVTPQQTFDSWSRWICSEIQYSQPFFLSSTIGQTWSMDVVDVYTWPAWCDEQEKLEYFLSTLLTVRLKCPLIKWTKSIKDWALWPDVDHINRHYHSIQMRSRVSPGGPKMAHFHCPPPLTSRVDMVSGVSQSCGQLIEKLRSLTDWQL